MLLWCWLRERNDEGEEEANLQNVPGSRSNIREGDGAHARQNRGECAEGRAKEKEDAPKVSSKKER